nr:hypothetical protein [Tanacetum cinerariifolium]
FGALTGEATCSMIEATTSSEVKIGDSVRTIEGWTSSMLLLLVGCTVSLVASVSHSTTGGREEEVVDESGVAEPELGKPKLDKLVLDKPEVGFDHVKLPGRIGFFL